ncbi:MAG: hypothetical protein K2X66_15725 [Cyanobacteria bacterium]|nr:hypothetical protein [Cyanobacteriota bacterium]
MKAKPFLALSFQQDLHVRYVEECLKRRGESLILVDWRNFPDTCQIHIEYSKTGNLLTLETEGHSLSPETLSAVWVRRIRHAESQNLQFDESAQAFATTEAQGMLSALPDLWHKQCPWVSLPDLIYRGCRKPYQAMVAQSLGFVIPETLFSNNPERASAFVRRLQTVALKPVASLWIENPSAQENNITEAQLQKNEVVDVDLTVLYTRKFEAEQLLPQLDGLAHCPAILQQYIPKDLELRVTVVGERVFACAIYSQEHSAIQEDWRRQRVDGFRFEAFTLPPETEGLCIRLVKALGLDFGCLDLILTPEGEFVFLEINPLGQWLWIEEKSGLPIADALIDMLLEKAGRPISASMPFFNNTEVVTK